VPDARSARLVSVPVGIAAAIALFVVVALTQMLGDVGGSDASVEETALVFDPPDIEEVQSEAPPPPPEEPPPELEEDPPLLSLDQLDIALNPGTGGGLAGDFALPRIEIGAAELGQEVVDFSNLDQMPRPVGVAGLSFPSRLLKRKASGRIVLLLKLSDEGKVLEVRVDSSTLPEFEEFVVGEVRRWRFTPPTQEGRPVNALARLPIPIQVN
jgi:protein TonB